MTWCRPRPYKVARVLRTPMPVRSQKYFPPAALLCRPYKLRPAAADARAVAVAGVRALRIAVATTATTKPARCCHRRCRWVAAGRDRQQAAEGVRDLSDWPEEGGCPPHSSLPALARQRVKGEPRVSRFASWECRWTKEKPRASRVCVCVCACQPSSFGEESAGQRRPDGRLASSEREKECLLFAYSSGRWTKVSPLLVLSFRRTIRVCVRSRRDVFYIESPPRLLCVAEATVISNSLTSSCIE